MLRAPPGGWRISCGLVSMRITPAGGPSEESKLVGMPMAMVPPYSGGWKVRISPLLGEIPSHPLAGARDFNLPIPEFLHL